VQPEALLERLFDHDDQAAPARGDGGGERCAFGEDAALSGTQAAVEGVHEDLNPRLKVVLERC
jgi:hypothetical protein